MPKVDTTAVKKAIKKIEYQGVKYHIAVGDLRAPTFGFGINSKKMVPLTGGVIGTVELRAGTLVVKGSEIKSGHIKAINNALKVANTGLVCSDKAPMLDGTPDANDNAVEEQQQRPLLDELDDLVQRSAALNAPLPKAPFDAIGKLILGNKPDLAKAKKFIVELRGKIDQAERGAANSASRQEANDSIKARAEQSKLETATKAARNQELMVEWQKLLPDIKSHIKDIAEVRGSDPKVLVARAKEINAAIKKKDFDKLPESVPFFLQSIALVEKRKKGN